MLWPLTWVVIIGTMPGVLIGAWVRIVYSICFFVWTGGTSGHYLGAHAQKYAPAAVIKAILCVCILAVAGK
jgi:uncharacterized membrane protein YfcA